MAAFSAAAAAAAAAGSAGLVRGLRPTSAIVARGPFGGAAVSSLPAAACVRSLRRPAPTLAHGSRAGAGAPRLMASSAAAAAAHAVAVGASAAAAARALRRRRTASVAAPGARASCCRGARRHFSDFIHPGSAQGSNRLRLAFAAACLPHPDKAKKGGEDAYFASPRRRAFGVADGVGGWAESGVDPGEYSRCLLRYAHEGILDGGPAEAESDLQEALMTAARRLHQSQLQGGSTALLGQLNGSTMGILNLGDSGAMLLRPALRTPPGSDQPLLFPRVVFRSSDQTHYFNCPYQLGSSAAPIEAPDFVRIRVRTGDIVVAATDGVFDNLFDHQVQAIVARHLGGAWRSGASVEPQLQGLATSIVKQAQRIGQQEDQKDVITPFALAAHSEGLPFRGGKLDDTTVVVGLVCEGPPAEDDAAGGEPDDKLPPLHNLIR